MRLLLVLLMLAPSSALAGSYTISNTFTGGTTALASEVNANFTGAKTAIDDNDLRIDALLATDTCTSPPCALTAGTTLNGGTIQVPADNAVFLSLSLGPAATPTLLFEDTVAADTFPEATIVGNAVADDNGRLELRVEDGSDGTYNSGVIVEATSGTTIVKLGAGSTAGSNFVQIAENGVMTAQGSATITATAVAANAVALSTGTTGNYVATIADSGSSEVTVTGSGSEGAAVTLGLAAGITRDAELSAYTTGTSTPVDGSTACNTGDMHLETDAFKIYFCVDGATDEWYGVALSDTP